jgi:ribosomal protein S18 acetylase RimI-like enzyme
MPTAAAPSINAPVIAPITPAYAASFHACLDAVAREKRWLAQVEAPPLDRVEAFVQDSVAADAAQFVALDGDVVVGWADIFPAWAHAVAHTGTLGMGLLPAWRGRGLGRQLLQACIGKARAQGITRVTLQARADNTAAIRLYKRTGFVHEARLHRAMRFDGVYFDAEQMSLWLG